MPRRHSGDREIVEFQFTNQAQIDWVIAQNWDGTLNPRTLVHLVQYEGAAAVMRRTFSIYEWKARDIAAAFRLTKNKSPDTWLTSPYVPRFKPKRLP